MHLDWSSLALQTINVLVLLWLLKRFLFRPVADIVAARRQETERLLAEAEAARTEARQSADELARREAAGASEAAALRAAARQAAEIERQRLLAEAEADIARRRAVVAQSLRRIRQDQRLALQGEARALAGSIAARLLARLPGPAATAAFLAGLDALLDGLPEDQLHALAAGPGALEVVSAAPLSPDEQQRCAALLARHLAQPAPPRFRADKALLAGIELHAAHAVLRHSWQAELERVAQELAKDQTDGPPVLA